MARKRAFISFDFDNDDDIRNALVGQAKYPNSPFEIVDASVRRHLRGDWKKQVRSRIRRADLVIVMCGERTYESEGVAVEVKITQEEGKPYFLLNGRNNKVCTKPATALHTDKIHQWTWANLKLLIQGKNSVEEAIEVLAWVGLGALSAAILIQFMEDRRNRQQRFRSGDLATRRPQLTSSSRTPPWL